MEYGHVPVLRDSVVDLIALGPAGVVVDGTVGLGGHAEAILSRLPEVRLLGLDVDAAALDVARHRLARFGERVRFVQGSYARLDDHLHAAGFEHAAGVVLDLGVSSLQIDRAERGFSYRLDGPLDMRMDSSAATSAAGWLEAATENEITTVLSELGEERFARKIAREIVARRREAPFRTTAELAAVVRSCVPGRKPVASLARVFQGVRMWVNGELENLTEGMRRALGVLAPGALFAVLAYHSLEDRMVKQFFRRQVEGCVCPPTLPRCGCGFVAGFRLLTRKAVQASPAEVAENPRARSVRLRALQRAA